MSVKESENIGSFLSNSGDEIDEITTMTNLDGVARVVFQTGEQQDVHGYITVRASGNESKDVMQELAVSLMNKSELENKEYEGEYTPSEDDITGSADSNTKVSGVSPKITGMMFPLFSPYMSNLLANSFDPAYDFRVGPNPVILGSKNYVFFDLEDSEEVILSICDMGGEEIYSFKPEVVYGTNIVELATTDLEEDNYLIFMKHNGKWVGSYFFTVID